MKKGTKVKYIGKVSFGNFFDNAVVTKVNKSGSVDIAVYKAKDEVCTMENVQLKDLKEI